jgi:hypothetical protein
LEDYPYQKVRVEQNRHLPERLRIRPWSDLELLNC